MAAGPTTDGAPAALPDVVAVTPADGPIDGVGLALPGSKSYTNRALAAAALARGRSRLDGVLFADDTEAMLGCVSALGATVGIDRAAAAVVVEGTAGRPASTATLDARYSGTTARFILAVLAAGSGPYLLDAVPAFRRRPMGDGFAALRSLGLSVAEREVPGHLPVEVSGGPVRGGEVRVRGDASSQFLSGLILVGPVLEDGLALAIDGELVSRSYVDLTLDVIRSFGATGEWVDVDRLVVAPGGYDGADYRIEPDASAASYPLAAAAITGGLVRIDGLGSSSRQGDLALVGILERMGAHAAIGPDRIELRGPAPGRLQGVEVDMRDCSDVAQTLAVVAVFADGPTTITGIGFIRGKETDRIAAMATELRRAGIEVDELPDGLRIHPGPPRPTRFATYEDHRMAMSLALIGLVVPGVEIADPGCVAKTFPTYFELLSGLTRGRG